MEYLADYTDVSKISSGGWGGTKTFENGCLVLTAVNGWESHGWLSDEWVGKDVVFDFDYWVKADDTFWWIGLGSLDSVSYFASPIIKDFKFETWAHCTLNIQSAQKAIGINVRGLDKSGRTYVAKLKNVRIHSPDSNLSFSKNGIITNSYLETDVGNAFLGPDSISATEFIEI